MRTWATKTCGKWFIEESIGGNLSWWCTMQNYPCKNITFLYDLLNYLDCWRNLWLNQQVSSNNWNSSNIITLFNWSLDLDLGCRYQMLFTALVGEWLCCAISTLAVLELLWINAWRLDEVQNQVCGLRSYSMNFVFPHLITCYLSACLFTLSLCSTLCLTCCAPYLSSTFPLPPYLSVHSTVLLSFPGSHVWG